MSFRHERHVALVAIFLTLTIMAPHHATPTLLRHILCPFVLSHLGEGKKMKNLLLLAMFLVASVGLAGCDVEQGGTSGAVSPATTPPAVDDDGGVDIDIDAADAPLGDSAADNRIERRQERRENLREAIDDVDVNVGNGGVDVNVD
tara:strand:+ start:4101 stop:4538 length:438 start_codon:yes stop_codon:yes gene_type:complete